MGSSETQKTRNTTNTHREYNCNTKMKLFPLLCFASLCLGAPQYSGEQSSGLDAASLDTIAEIFGKQGGDGYAPDQQAAALADDVDVLVQVIQESNEYPNDYVPESAQQVVDEATVEVNTDFENCADYTESLGYECVPYYQCHNGTIITDGAGLIDIRNGFGSLTPEDSKCPGFLDVCCKDPDFTPPPKIVYAPKCGRRNQNGLGVRIQGFQQCTVTWETPSAPLVDISSFERKPDTSYGTTDTKADQTDAYVEPSNAKQTDAYVEPSNAEQTDAYVEPSNAKQTDAYVDPNAAQTDAYTDTKSEQTDGSYSDDSSPVKITQDPYTDDNAKLVSDNTDGYAEEKTADIVEEIKTAPY